MCVISSLPRVSTKGIGLDSCGILMKRSCLVSGGYTVQDSNLVPRVKGCLHLYIFKRSNEIPDHLPKASAIFQSDTCRLTR